jgi:hypothetical protein
MAEEKVRLVWQQISDVHLLHAEQDIAVGQILLEAHAGSSVFGIGDAPHRTRLHDEIYLRVAPHKFLTL